MNRRRRPIRIVTCGIAVCALAFGLVALRAAQGPPPPPPPASSPIARGTSTLSGVVVLGDSDKPVAGALVQVQQVRLGGNTSRLRAQLTDASGRFVFTQLPGGMPVRLLASKSGYLDGGAGFDVPEPDPSVILQNAEWRPDVRLPLWRAAVISGVVRDERESRLSMSGCEPWRARNLPDTTA